MTHYNQALKLFLNKLKILIGKKNHETGVIAKCAKCFSQIETQMISGYISCLAQQPGCDVNSFQDWTLVMRGEAMGVDEQCAGYFSHLSGPGSCY